MKRSEFLRIAGAGSAAVVLGLTSCSNKEKFVLEEVPDNSRIRLGIIGVGDRGYSILTVLRNVPEFKVVAICDLFDFRLTRAKEIIPNEVKTYKNFEEMLAQKNIDAVVIASPLHEHHRMVKAGFERDIHILCEKALAHSIEQCKDINAHAKNSNKLFQVSYQYQMNPMFQAIKEIIREGYLGSIARVECTWDRHGDWRRELPPAEVAYE